MSTTIKLDIFTLKIREKGTKNLYLPLNDVAGFNLIDEISIYLTKNIYLFKIDDKAERTSRIEKKELKDNSLYCRIKIGKFGETSEIVDTLSGSGIFNKERKHSDTIPLFFHIYIENGATEATIHVEKKSTRTLIPELKNILNAVLNNLREDMFTFELKPLKKEVSLKSFLDQKLGTISSVNLTLNSSINSELTENLTINIKTRPRKQFESSFISKIVKSSESSNFKHLKSLLPEEIKNVEIIKSDAILKTDNGGKINVDVTKPIFLSSSISEVTQMDNLDKLGHPSFNYLKEVSNRYMF